MPKTLRVIFTMGRTHRESRLQKSEAKKWLCVISMVGRERQKVRVRPTVSSHCFAGAIGTCSPDHPERTGLASLAVNAADYAVLGIRGVVEAVRGLHHGP